MRKILLTISLLLLPVIAHSAVEISDVYELQDMMLDRTADYVLINDIDASTTTTWNYNAERDVYEGFDPIGDASTRFTGTFDGQGFVISDLYINREIIHVSLFGFLGDSGNSATVENFGLKDVYVKGSGSVGSVGSSYYNSVIKDVWATGEVVGGDFNTGGISGLTNHGGKIYTSYFSGSVTGVNRVGGIVGMNYGEGGHVVVEDCYAFGTVEGEESVGGVVGWNYDRWSRSYVTRSFSAASVTGTTNVGGLIGRIDKSGSVTDSFWNTETSNQASSADGTGKTTSQMTDHENSYPDSYTNFDFTDIWQVTSWNTDQEDNAGYPALAWQTDPTPTPTPVIEKWIPYIIRYD